MANRTSPIPRRGPPARLFAAAAAAMAAVLHAPGNLLARLANLRLPGLLGAGRQPARQLMGLALAAFGAIMLAALGVDAGWLGFGGGSATTATMAAGELTGAMMAIGGWPSLLGGGDRIGRNRLGVQPQEVRRPGLSRVVGQIGRLAIQGSAAATLNPTLAAALKDHLDRAWGGVMDAYELPGTEWREAQRHLDVAARYVELAYQALEAVAPSERERLEDKVMQVEDAVRGSATAPTRRR
ncbi:MAG: hypothetical protein WKF82_02845 [Nocardioidaceae bacterium]